MLKVVAPTFHGRGGLQECLFRDFSDFHTSTPKKTEGTLNHGRTSAIRDRHQRFWTHVPWGVDALAEHIIAGVGCTEKMHEIV